MPDIAADDYTGLAEECMLSRAAKHWRAGIESQQCRCCLPENCPDDLQSCMLCAAPLMRWIAPRQPASKVSKLDNRARSGHKRRRGGHQTSTFHRKGPPQIRQIVRVGATRCVRFIISGIVFARGPRKKQDLDITPRPERRSAAGVKRSQHSALRRIPPHSQHARVAPPRAHQWNAPP